MFDRRSLPALLAVLLAGLALAPPARAWRCPSNYRWRYPAFRRGLPRGRLLGLRARYPMGPTIAFAHPAFYRPVPVRQTKDHRYARARDKGHRAYARGDLGKAEAQYRDALDRATRFWGPLDRRTAEARKLLDHVRDRRHGVAD